MAKLSSSDIKDIAIALLPVGAVIAKSTVEGVTHLIGTLGKAAEEKRDLTDEECDAIIAIRHSLVDQIDEGTKAGATSET